MIFDLILKNKLIFNTCWEDPRIDRKHFQINEKSHLLTITSAGCNALEYLLDNPAQVNCCDINPAQNSVLELKIALFKNGDYELLWDFFGRGGFPEADVIYRSKLRDKLSDKAQEYWDKSINYFSSRKSFYRRGASGRASTLIMTYLKTNKQLKNAIQELFDSNSIEEQREVFNNVEDRLWTNFTKMLLDNYLIHYLLGVPRNQYRAAMLNNSSLYTYIKTNFKRVFTEYPAKENHFWKLYFYGQYDDIAKPKYLESNKFDEIRSKVDRINIHYTQLQDILDAKPITHINLLDHQDWHIGKSNYITELWTKIIEKETLQHVIMRTASPAFDLPEHIREKFIFTPREEIELGMVGTYYEAIHAIKK